MGICGINRVTEGAVFDEVLVSSEIDVFYVTAMLYCHRLTICAYQPSIGNAYSIKIRLVYLIAWSERESKIIISCVWTGMLVYSRLSYHTHPCSYTYPMELNWTESQLAVVLVHRLNHVLFTQSPCTVGQQV